MQLAQFKIARLLADPDSPEVDEDSVPGHGGLTAAAFDHQTTFPAP